MGELKENGLLHQDTHSEIQGMGINRFFDAILCKSDHIISLESVIEQFSEHGFILTSDEIAWLEKEMVSFSLESIDDDDIASLSSEFKTRSDEICRALADSLADCKPIDESLPSYDPPCKLEKETADYSLGNNNFLEADNQDFDKIVSNCEVNDDTDKQIKAIIEAMKMDW